MGTGGSCGRDKMTKLICPKCAFEFRPDDAFADGELRDIINLLPRFQGHGKLAFEYCELFGVTPLRLKTKKLLRLLQEVSALFGSEIFHFQRKEYSISVAGIAEALRTVCNKHFERPLENHNYLKKVMIGIAERERKDVRDRADREQKGREQGRREEDKKGRREEGEKVLTAEEYKKKKGIESLAERIGKKMNE